MTISEHAVLALPAIQYCEASDPEHDNDSIRLHRTEDQLVYRE